MMRNKWNFLRYASLGVFVSTNVLMILLFILSKWPKYWEHINYEYSHLTWLSSVNLVLAGLFCLFCFALSELNNPQGHSMDRYILGALGGGFLFLALDEKFQIHEKLRENIFIPHQVGTDIPGVGSGDFTHILFALVGLGMSYFIIKRIKVCRVSVVLFSMALLTAVISVVTDTTSPVVRDDSVLSPAQLMESINHQFVEELFESSAIIFFAATFLNHFYMELKALLKSELS